MSFSAPIFMVEPSLGPGGGRGLPLNALGSGQATLAEPRSTSATASIETAAEQGAAFAAFFTGALWSENALGQSAPTPKQAPPADSTPDLTRPTLMDALLAGLSAKATALNPSAADSVFAPQEQDTQKIEGSRDAQQDLRDIQSLWTRTRKTTLAAEDGALLKALMAMLQQGSAPAPVNAANPAVFSLGGKNETVGNEIGIAEGLPVSRGLEALARRLLALDLGNAVAPETRIAADGQEEPTELKGLLQAGSKDAGRAGGLSLVPDLIYFQSRGGSNETGADAPKAGSVLLVAAPRSAEGRPIEVLQTLMRGIGSSQNSSDSSLKTGSETADPRAAQSIESRLSVDNGSTNAAGALRTHASILADSVRQIQAVMSDMVERMRGDVRFDTDGMRAVLHLDPPYLGRVHIQLSIDSAHHLEAQVSADNPGTRDFLQQNQPDLRQELEQQGFQAEDVNITFHEEEGTPFSSWVAGPTLI